MTGIIDLATYVAGKWGNAPAGRVKCRGCAMPLELFAIVKGGDGVWRCGHCRVAAGREDAPAFQLSWADVRGQRDMLLAACDWTQLSDVPEPTRLLWQPYRQALRDITDQECEPDQVIWPIKPGD